MRVRSQVVAAALLSALSISAMFAQDPAKSGPNVSSETNSEAYRAPNPDFGTFMPQNSTQKSPSMSEEQGTPAAELFAGYSYLRFNPRINGSQTFDNQGGTASLAGNVNRWLGLVADFGVYHVSGDLQPGSSGKAYTYLLVRASPTEVNGGRRLPQHSLARHA